MRVRNDFSYDVQKRQGKRDIGFSKFSFGADAPAPAQPAQKVEEPKEKGSFIKKATNFLGVAAWLFMVGYSIKKLRLLEPSYHENVAKSAKNYSKRTLSYIEKLADPEAANISKVLEEKGFKGPSKFVRKAFYGIGDWFQNWKMNMGSELVNNLTYAFGTLVVMPLVVLFSPFGKKNSSKEDKAFAVLRQPLSVAATLGMQFTFDKLIDKYVPEVLKQNKFEEPAIVGENGKIVWKNQNNEFLADNFNKIIYNKDEAKEAFKEYAKNVLSEDEIKELFTDRSFEEGSTSELKTRLKDILNKKYAEAGLKLDKIENVEVNDINRKASSFSEFKKIEKIAAENIEDLLVKFKKFASVLDNNKMAIQKCKTGVNVVAASIIGCTFLNVIYGKFMKALKKPQEQQAKEVK
ncbi:MAG TPA: hypothetical protein PLG15_02730 [Candidatus Gastranaerophilaceae bacterium]|nr:hypothetical protein [Candidatus Gastranaerophilaceae bacterium]HPT41279.1 hypothetical protein [Candidatus Gastranaerophilaceae bacterium]